MVNKKLTTFLLVISINVVIVSLNRLVVLITKVKYAMHFSFSS